MMILKQGNWKLGRIHNQNDTKNGTFIIDDNVTKILYAGDKVAIASVVKGTIKPYEEGDNLLGIIAFPSNFTLPQAWTNVYDDNLNPPFLKGQSVPVLLLGMMDVLLKEDFEDPADFNQYVYVLPNGELSKKQPMTGKYYNVGKLKFGTGKQVVVLFNFELTHLIDRTTAPATNEEVLKRLDKTDKALESIKKETMANKKNIEDLKAQKPEDQRQVEQTGGAN